MEAHQLLESKSVSDIVPKTVNPKASPTELPKAAQAGPGGLLQSSSVDETLSQASPPKSVVCDVLVSFVRSVVFLTVVAATGATR